MTTTPENKEIVHALAKLGVIKMIQSGQTRNAVYEIDEQAVKELSKGLSEIQVVKPEFSIKRFLG